MDELLEQFVIEGRELVAQAGGDLLAMGQAPGYDEARTDSAFRAIHTLKGSAGLFDMAPLGAALHAAEDVMAGLRQARRKMPAEALEALLDCVGAAEDWIEAASGTGRLPEDAAARAHGLVAALRAGLPGAPAGTPALPEAAPDWLAPLLASVASQAARTALRYVPDPGCFFVGDDPLALVRAMPDLLALRLLPREAWSLAEYDPFRCNLVILALSAAPTAVVRDLFRLLPGQAQVVAVPGQAALPQPASDAAGTPSAVAALPKGARTLRVPSERMDALADLVSELFAVRSRLAHLAADAGAPPGLARALAATQAELDRLAGLMHRTVTSLRLVPLDQTLRRLPRLVRETAARLGRDVRFTIEGAGVQADRATVDALFEPLLHVLRNAVDHGVAPPDVRRAEGKPPQGHIALRAALDGGQVVITVADDGAGIDAAALRRAAAARGVAEPASLAAMDDDAVRELIFQPGLSTAAAVTDTSGRGVGMDAVRTALHAIGGQVGLGRAAAGGTVIRISVPQSASITTLVTVLAGGEAFGVPAEMIVETTRIARASIVPLQAGQVFVLRDATIPLLGLAALLGLDTPAPVGPWVQVLVAGIGGRRVGLAVDGFGTRLEAVVQTLPALLAGTRGVRGAALLGDGGILLVLDLAELAAWA